MILILYITLLRYMKNNRTLQAPVVATSVTGPIGPPSDNLRKLGGPNRTLGGPGPSGHRLCRALRVNL